MTEIIASDGSRLHYALHGTGATELILLHGMGATGASWEPVLAQLDLAAFRVLVPDLRGHGRSSGGEDRFTYPQLTADILALADAVGFHAATIVSQSGSGKNAACVARTAPQRVRGLVLLAPPGFGEVPLPREMLRELFDYIGREHSFPPGLETWFGPKIGPHRATVIRSYVETPRRVLDASAELWVHTSVAATAAEITQPVLVLAGAREPLYHPAYQRETTLTTLPHARLEVLDCSHFMTFEEPAAVAAALTTFCGAGR